MGLEPNSNVWCRKQKQQTRYLTVSKTERNTLYTRDCVKLLITHKHSLDVQEHQSIGIRGVVFRVIVLSVDYSHSISSLL